ncbi:uncharacterized protein LOC116253933 isoform X1 [Nymphaea colorata]|nr:uncharacterized protein LOC116253933 isoform X1 [Nymphaea colorata]XP_031484793.1 uncharacterized protein LOC116253933 isoform X1 [Nymphaea colorata]XP_049933674.1 uncharacterized protein LOC116253933 isoform X1 [Nymphaea colorata]
MHRVCRTLLKLKKICPPRQSPSSDLNDFKRWVSLGLPRGSRFATGFTPLQFKPLDSIIDTQRVSQYSAEELVKIWDDYHLGRGHVSASVDQKLYHLLDQRAITCQHFVIPLPRGSGYTTIFSQAKMPHILFTGLEDYKARGTQAAPYFTVTYYKEFAETKGVVLVRGDIVFTSKLSDSEARWLLETTHSFYMNDTRYKLVERFNRETRDFEFEDVLSSLGISAG